jgi:hypothetical protein
MFKRKQVVRKVVKVLFLSDEDLLFRTQFWRRYWCGSSEGRGYYGMTSTETHARSMQFYGISRLLLTLHQRILENRKSNYIIAKEEQEIHMVR